jgi:hypothetical protein
MKEQSCDEQLDGLEGRKWQQQAREVLVFCRSIRGVFLSVSALHVSKFISQTQPPLYCLYY